MVETMEIPRGFKKTDVGIIPNDWLLVSYDELFDFLTTATYSRSQLSENDTIKYVHYGDIHTKCVHFLDCDKIDLPSIKNELLKNYPLLKDGDLIVVDASEDYEGVGKSVEVKNLKNKKAISGLHTFLLRDKKEVITNGFKGYIQPNSLVKKQMDTLATGMKVYGVSKTNLKLIKIPLPPTKIEQTAIAEALNDADALITQLEKLIAKRRAIKQGAMQELLKPKEGWEVKPMGQIAELYQPVTISQEQFTDNGYLVYGANGIVGKYGKYNHELWQTTITCRGSTCGTVNKTINKCWITGNAMVANVDKNTNIDKLFFYFLLTKQDFSSCITGSGQPQIVRKPLSEFELSFPKEKSEQIRIAQILSDMDAEIEALEKKLDKYKMLKQGMMQNLLTGRIRLI